MCIIFGFGCWVYWKDNLYCAVHTYSPDWLEDRCWGQSHLVHYGQEAVLQKADDRWPTKLITEACCGQRATWEQPPSWHIVLSNKLITFLSLRGASCTDPPTLSNCNPVAWNPETKNQGDWLGRRHYAARRVINWSSQKRRSSFPPIPDVCHRHCSGKFLCPV